MRVPKIFQASEADIDALVDAYPFGLVIAQSEGDISATPLPLLLERRADGSAVIMGHFARANPQVAKLRADGRALIVFQGPHGYISPSWLTDKTQAPTWNFAMVQFSVEVTFRDTQEAARRAVDTLTARMEFGRPNAWNTADMGDRYQKLLPGIIAFEARVMGTVAKFKLGQNEREAELDESLCGLESAGQTALASLMRRANHP